MKKATYATRQLRLESYLFQRVGKVATTWIEEGRIKIKGSIITNLNFPTMNGDTIQFKDHGNRWVNMGKIDSI